MLLYYPKFVVCGEDEKMINKLLFLISYVVLMLMIIILVFDNQALEKDKEALFAELDYYKKWSIYLENQLLSKQPVNTIQILEIQDSVNALKRSLYISDTTKFDTLLFKQNR